MKKLIWLAIAVLLLAIVLVYPGLVSVNQYSLPSPIVAAADNATQNATDVTPPAGESFFDIFPPVVWIVLIIIVVIVIGLMVFLLMTPSKKKGKGAPAKGGKLQSGGKPGSRGKPGEELAPRRPGMQGMGPGQGNALQGQGMQGMQGDQFGQPDMQQGRQPGGPGQTGFQGQQLPQQGQQGFAPQQRPQPGPMQQGQPMSPNQGMPQQGMTQMPQQGMPPRGPQGPQGQQAPMPQQGFPQQSAPGGPGRQPGPAPMMQPQPGAQQPMPQGQFQPQGGQPPQQPFAPQRFPQQPMQGQPFTPQQMNPQQPMAPMRPQPVTPQPMGMPPRPGMQPMGGQPPSRFTAPSGNRPSFTVSNLNIIPREVKEDDPVTISVTVTNASNVAGQYSVVFRINHVVENICELNLTPGASQTTEFTTTKEVSGEYFVEVDGQRGMFHVIERIPASFEISDLTVVPERVKQGQPIAIGFMVTNLGERPGVYHANLLIKGMSEATEEIQMEEGETKQVTFNIVKDTAGFYPVSVEGLTGRFVIEMDWREQGSGF